VSYGSDNQSNNKQGFVLLRLIFHDLYPSSSSEGPEKEKKKNGGLLEQE
jgi:hypothetical protein